MISLRDKSYKHENVKWPKVVNVVKTTAVEISNLKDGQISSNIRDFVQEVQKWNSADIILRNIKMLWKLIW